MHQSEPAFVGRLVLLTIRLLQHAGNKSSALYRTHENNNNKAKTLKQTYTLNARTLSECEN